MKKFEYTKLPAVYGWLLIIVFILPVNLIPQSLDESLFVNSKDSPVSIPNTEMRKLYSEIIGQEFSIYIQLPMSYNRDGTIIYPVMYFTDANRNFPMVANISTLLGFPKTKFPEIIIVGIGYNIRGMEDWAAWRTRDLTPTDYPEVNKYWEGLLSKLTGNKDIKIISGGASNFLSFIITELIPFIESNYRVSKSDRALGGYSYGGLFTLFTLFQHPEIFKRYFAGSPSIEWDSGIIFQFEEEYSKLNNDLNAKIFLSAGSLENKSTIDDLNKMISNLRSRNYPNLAIESNIFENENHISCYAAAVMRALVTLYKE